jgi:hypothetical protein
MNIWPLADPRLLLPRDLIAEHLAVHSYLRLRFTLTSDDVDFLILRHELLRIAANKRSGMKHSEQDTLNQRRHPSRLSPRDLQRLEPLHLRILTVYERWTYLRQRSDIELVDLLFHAMMKKAPYVPRRKYPTPWAALGCKPQHYYHEGAPYEVLRSNESRELARRP